jgi:hypothetical protein
MGVIDTVLDKLAFWRRDDGPDFDVDGCFTLPGAELDDPTPDDPTPDDPACDAPATEPEPEPGD